MTALLKVEGLSKTFGGLAAVRDLSFELKEGEIVGLIGPNGAGKSTAFNMISGSLPPTAGASCECPTSSLPRASWSKQTRVPPSAS